MPKKKKGGTTPKDSWDPWRPITQTGNAWEIPELNFENIFQIIFILLVFAVLVVIFGMMFGIDDDDFDYDYEEAARNPPPYPDYMGVKPQIELPVQAYTFPRTRPWGEERV